MKGGTSMLKQDAYKAMFEHGEEHRRPRSKQHKAAARTKNGIRILKFTVADAAHFTKAR